MEYQSIKRTDTEVSRICFGCWAIGGHGYGRIDDDTSVRAIQKALDLGINFFDTADVYGFGHSEKVLAGALGEGRHQVVIATKFGVEWDQSGRTRKNCSPSYIVSALESSLKRLGIDCIPIYQLHWHDGKTPLEDVMETLLRCQQAGKIKLIGISNLSEDMLKKAGIREHVRTNQCLYNLVQRENESLIQLSAKKFGQDILAYSVIGRGVFSGKYSSTSKFGENDTRRRDKNFHGNRYEKDISIADKLSDIGKKYGKTAAQVSIRWVLDNPLVSSAIVGIKSAVQAEENAGAAGWALTKDDTELIGSIVL